ncbi:HEAT repeat domain-containing protein [Aneurinibacillus uraniidurans]|uniref:HEAT repeat domain-containing protein n=1 Tax=Aneurinibacillus uraniidurans TaxID=2966586 RepID=UPI0023496904|nr:hypothetical protein [Aneurinibacillus sp. B1]WCN37837.1 hypothetical protein PO771_19270 [Aneurinibacillus sp. B1]
MLTWVPSDFLIRLLWLSFVSLFLLIIVIFGYLFFQKAMTIRKERKKEEWKRKIFPLVIQYLKGREKNIYRLFSPDMKWKNEIVEDVLYEIADTLQEEEYVRLHVLLKNAGIEQNILLSIQSKKPMIACRAMRRAGKFRMKHAASHIKSNLHHSSFDVWTTAIQALALLGEFDIVFQFLIRYHKEYPYFFAIRLFDMLKHASEQDLVAIKEQVPSLYPDLQGMFIDIIGYQKYDRYLPDIESFFESQYEFLRVKALKAAAQIGITIHHKQVIWFLQEGSVPEKLAALQIVRSNGSCINYELLEALAADKDWWVRLRALETLLSFGAEGIRRVKVISERHPDRFAREMAGTILEKMDRREKPQLEYFA